MLVYLARFCFQLKKKTKSCARSFQVQRGSLSDGAQHASDSAGRNGSSSAGRTVVVPYRGMWDVLSRIYRTGGVAGLFKGSGARMAFHAPSTAIAMATFEKAKAAWADALSVADQG